MWSKKKKKRALNTIITYGGPHKAWLVRGMLGTIGVVLFRLLMPWPLRGVVEVVFPRGSDQGKLLVDYLPAWGEPVVWLAGFYILIAIGLGISELIQRVNIMRFSSQTVHDMRSAAVRGLKGMPQQERTGSGDIIARIIGDSARIKAGLSGIMVHGLQNGLLFVLVCAVMLYISVVLGLIFLVAGLIALYIGISASTPVARTASRQRRKEGDYAAAITEELDYGGQDIQLEEINWSSARKEVRTTKIIAVSSLFVHVVLAAAVGLALWIGSYGVREGYIEPGELFLFIAYALTVHRRMVQVGRQSARTGKVLACADRIGAFLRNVGSAEVTALQPHVFVPIKTGLRLESVKLASVHGRDSRARLRRTSLTIRPETTVAVLGNIGSGKSSLLRVLAGVEFPDKGKIYWDDQDVSHSDDGLSTRVAYLPQDPVFPPTHLWKLIGLKEPGELTAEQEETLVNIEAMKIVKSFPKGLSKKVGLTSISRNEARLLRLAGLLIGDTSSVWVFDNPLQGFRSRKAEKCLDEIIKCASGRTVVISFSEPVRLESFDRVLYMRGGKVRFDGTPVEWEEWRRTQKEESKINRSL